MANLGISIGKQFPSAMTPQFQVMPQTYRAPSVLGLDAALGSVLKLGPFRSDVPNGSGWALDLKTCLGIEELP
jgi:hypothetical protein